MNYLSRIGSGLGNPLYADDCTTKIERVSYARMLINIDVTRPLPKSVKVEYLNEEVFEHEIIYDSKPMYYLTCLQVGHCFQQNKKLKQHQVLKYQDRQQRNQKKITKKVWMKAGQIKTLIQGEATNGKEVPENKGNAKEGEVGWTEVIGRSTGKLTKTTNVEGAQ